MVILSSAETFSLFSFAVFSLYDLRFRLAPAIEVFLLAAAVLACWTTPPLQVIMVIFAVLWGLGDWLPGWLPVILFFHPATWPILIIGAGVRRELIGRADLMALGGIACIFPWPALVLSILGFEFWRRWWVSRRNDGPIPAIPGLFLGLTVFVVGRALLSRH